MREMKNSGIEWIGDIPSDWKVCKLKNIIKFLNGYAFDSGVLKSDGLYPVIRIGDIINGKVDFSKANKIDEYNELLNRFTVAPNDVVIAMSGATVGKLGYIENVEVKSFINQRVGIIRSNLNKFVFYYLSSEAFLKYIQLLSEGTAQPNISTENINNFYITQPSKAEIDRIVSVLDKKCAEIDTVIEKTKATIEEYKKLKQSVITQAVTKGIRPNRQMKDSGVDWLGSLPENWSVSRIKYISDFEPFCDLSKLENESIVTYTPMECIKNGYFINRTEIFSKISSSLVSYQEGDIVMAKVTPCFENGNISIMNGLSSGVGMGSSELYVFRPTKINEKFLFYWLRSEPFKNKACSTMTGTGGLKRVSAYFVKNSEIFVPSDNEQKEIADYLDKKCSEIDELIAKKTALLSELESYKKSLIYEYVTGKKEV